MDFLESHLSPENYLDRVLSVKEHYEGFNLLVSDGEKLYYYSNYGGDPAAVQAGIHGISNAQINALWPKTTLAKTQLASLQAEGPDPDSLLSILKSTETYPQEQLPKTGVSAEMEAQLSAQLIRMAPNYGTVSATSVLRDRSGWTQLKERSFDWDYENYRDITFSFQP